MEVNLRTRMDKKKNVTPLWVTPRGNTGIGKQDRYTQRRNSYFAL